MAFFANAVPKVLFKILINKKDLKVAILNGNVAGEVVDQMIEIQTWNSDGCWRLIFRAVLFFDHDQIQLAEKIPFQTVCGFTITKRALQINCIQSGSPKRS